MDRPLDIAFHNIEPSPTVEAEIRRHAEKLQRRHAELVACRVSVEALHNGHRTGNVPEVHITCRSAATTARCRGSRTARGSATRIPTFTRPSATPVRPPSGSSNRPAARSGG
ncbi:hypothetical protein EAH89_07470 [Roseomonas nepalensis]|uniref:Uncharacterized protein n=1 Tax=Muricoccus nepalensis TaxID=1854500 RepID=A0A502GBV2_9PROT|nr:HPF/RaiA family ribosome-associated protein [Roseomonas nepalensis]TPG59172.1 hypothetical protein EAH89_07470 [Roseomonas nepalensis]